MADNTQTVFRNKTLDRIASPEIFRTQGGFMWGQYVKAHYNPRQGLE
jgi:hypothetical protein